MIYKVSELDFPRTNLRIYFAEICTILKIQTGENVLFFKCLTTDWPFSVCLYLTVLPSPGAQKINSERPEFYPRGLVAQKILKIPLIYAGKAVLIFLLPAEPCASGRQVFLPPPWSDVSRHRASAN